MRQERLQQIADELDTIGSWFHNTTRQKRCHELAEELRTGNKPKEQPPAKAAKSGS